MRLTKRQKASLNLSINAIVILILAITMLGLGLSFMKGLFGKTTGQLEEVGESIKDQMIEQLRKSNAKLTFDREDISIKQGSAKDVYFGIKNVLPTVDTETFEIQTACDKALDSAVTNIPDHIDIQAFGETRALPQGGIDVQKMVVQAKPRATTTTYSCAMNILDPADSDRPYASKSFYVTVN
jgi:hypothetical protein